MSNTNSLQSIVSLIVCCFFGYSGEASAQSHLYNNKGNGFFLDGPDGPVWDMNTTEDGVAFSRGKLQDDEKNTALAHARVFLYDVGGEPDTDKLFAHLTQENKEQGFRALLEVLKFRGAQCVKRQFIDPAPKVLGKKELDLKMVAMEYHCIHPYRYKEMPVIAFISYSERTKKSAIADKEDSFDFMLPEDAKKFFDGFEFQEFVPTR